MTEVRMTPKEIIEEIKVEESFGVNTLLQNLFSLSNSNNIDLEDDNIQVFKVLDSEGKIIDYKIRNKNGEDIQL